MAKDDGGPAFPRPHTTVDANSPWFKLGAAGMSLRDWFAGMALPPFVADMERWNETHPDAIHSLTLDVCAMSAYQIADAMLKARKRD
jgi:hypothetical protein